MLSTCYTEVITEILPNPCKVLKPFSAIVKGYLWKFIIYES